MSDMYSFIILTYKLSNSIDLAIPMTVLRDLRNIDLFNICKNRRNLSELLEENV